MFRLRVKRFFAVIFSFLLLISQIHIGYVSLDTNINTETEHDHIDDDVDLNVGNKGENKQNALSADDEIYTTHYGKDERVFAAYSGREKPVRAYGNDPKYDKGGTFYRVKEEQYNNYNYDGQYSLTTNDFELVPEETFKSYGKTGGDKNYLKRDFIIVQGAIPLTDIDDDKFAATSIDEKNWTSELAFDTYIKGGEFNNEYKNYPIYNDEITDDGLKKIKWQSVNSELVFGILIRVQLNCENTKHPHYEKTQNKIFYLTAVLNGEAYTNDGQKVTCKDKDKSYDYVKLTIDKDAPFHFSIQESDEDISSYGVSYGSSTYTWNIPSAISDASKRKVGHVWGIIDKTVSNMALDKSIYNEDNNANIRTKKQENQISLINGVGSSQFNADAAKYIKDYVGAFDKTTQKFENNHLPERVPFHYGLNALLQCEVCQLGQHSSYSAENAFIVPIFSVGKLAPASCEINAQYDLMSSLKISDIRNYYLNIYSDYEIKPSAKDGSPTLYDIIDVSMSTSRRVDTSFTRSNWAASRYYEHTDYRFPEDALIYADGDELSGESVATGGPFYGGDLGLLDNALALGHHWEVDTTVGNDGWLWKDVEGSAEMIATIYFVCTRPECLRRDSNHGYPIYTPNKTMSFAVKTTTDVSEPATCTSPGKFGYKSEDVFKSETFNEYLKQQDGEQSGNYRVTFDTFYITDEKGTREVLFERTINGNEQGKFRGKFVFGGDEIVQLQDGQDNIELSSTMASGLSSLPLGHVWTNVFGNVSELSFSEVTGFNGDDILNAIKAGENTDEISANILKFINVDATSIKNANTCPYKNAEIIQESNGWLWMKETNSSGYKIYAVLLMQCGRVDTHFEALVFSEFSNVVGSYDEGEAEYVTSGQSHDYPEMETYRKRISLTALNNDLIKGETEANPDNRDGGYKYKSTYYDSFGRVQYDRYLSSYNDTHDRQAAPHQWIPDTRYDGYGWEWITTTSDSSVKITKAILHLTCNDDNCNATETITFDVDSENIKKLEKEPSVTYEEIDDYSIAMYHHPTDCYSDGVHKYYAKITTNYLKETYIAKHPESSIRDFDKFYSDMSHVKTEGQTAFFLNDYTYAADTVATSGHSWTLDTSINETIENKEGLSFSVDELAKIKDLKFTNGIAYKLQDGKDVPSNKNPIYDVYFVLKCSNYETEKSHYIILKVPLTGSYIWSCTESGHAIINLEDAIVKINEYLGNSTTFSETNIEEIKTTTNNHTNHGTAIHDSFDHEIIRTAGTDGGSTILIKYDQNPYDQNPKGHKWTLNTNIDRDGFEWISVTTINGLHFAPRIYFICEECHETMYIDGTNEAYLKFADGGISVTETIQNLSCEEWGAQYLDGILTITEKFYERLKTDKVITEYDQFCLKGNSVTTKPNPGLKYVADRYFASDEVAPLGHSWIVDTSAKQTYSKEQYIDAAGNVYDLSGGKYKDAEGNEHEVSTITASKILSSTLINGYEWVKVEGSDTYRVFVHYVCTNNILVSDEGIDGPSTIATESHKMVKEIKNDEFKDPKSSVAKLTSDETYHTDENGYVAPTCTDDGYYVWQAVIGNITMSHEIRKPSHPEGVLTPEETINDVFNIDVNLTSCILNEISGEKTGHTYVLNTSVDNDGLQDGFTWDVETNGGDITVVNGATLNFTCETCGALFTHTFSTEDMKTEDVLPTHDKDGFKKYSVSITMSELQREIESFSRFSDAEAKKETYSSSAEVRNAEQKHTGHKWEPVEDGTTLPGGWKFTDIGDGKVEVTVTVKCVADDCDAEATITILDEYVTKTTVDAICTLFAYTVVRVGKEEKKVVDGDEKVEIVGFDLYSYVKGLGSTQFTDMDVFYDRKGYVLDPRNNIEDSENSNHAIYDQYIERYNTLIEKEAKESLSTDEENELKTIRENVIFAGYLDWKEYTDLMAEKEKADESRKEEIDARLDELIHKNVIADFHEGHQYNEDGSLNHGRLLETYSYTIDNPANGHNWIVDTSVYSDGYEWKWNETGTEPTKVTLHLICSNCGKEKTFEFTGIDASADHSDNSKQIKATLHEANCYHGDYYTYEVNFELDKSQTIFDGVHIRIDNSVHDYNGELLEMVNKGYISQSVVDEYLIDYEWKGEDGKYIYDSYSSLTGNDKKSTRDGESQTPNQHTYVLDESQGNHFIEVNNNVIVKTTTIEGHGGWDWYLVKDEETGTETIMAKCYFKCDNVDHDLGVDSKCPFTYSITVIANGTPKNGCTEVGLVTYTARAVYQEQILPFYDTFEYGSDSAAPGHNWRIDTTFAGKIENYPSDMAEDFISKDLNFTNGIAKVVKENATGTTGATYTVYVKLVCTVDNESIVVKYEMVSNSIKAATCVDSAVAIYDNPQISIDIFDIKDNPNIVILEKDGKKTSITENDHFANGEATLDIPITLTDAEKTIGEPNGHTWKIDTNYGNGTGWTWELLGENKATATLHFVCGTCGATFEMVQKGLVGVALEKPSCTEDQRVTYTSTMPEFTFEEIVGKGQIEGSPVTIINSYSNITAYDKYSTDGDGGTSGTFLGKEGNYQGEYIPKTGHVWKIDTEKNGNIAIKGGTHTFDNGICWEKHDTTYTLYVYLVCANGHHAIAKAEIINGIVTEPSCSTSGSIEYSYSLLLSDVNYKLLLDETPEETKLDKLFESYLITHTDTEGLEATGHLWKVDESKKTVYQEGADNKVISGWTWESNPNGTYTATLHLICEYCGQTQEIIFDGINGDESKTPATCTEAGQKTYTATFTPSENTNWNKTGIDKLKDNPESLTSSYMISIPALGHEWVISTENDTNGVKDGWTWSDDNSHATLHLSCNHTDCTYYKTEEYTITVATTNVVEEPTCTTDGKTTYKATIDSTHYGKTINDNFNDAIDNKYEVTKEVTQQALGHNWVIVTDNDTEDGIQDGFVWVKDGNSYKVTLNLKCANEEEDPLTFTIIADSVETHETKQATCLKEGTKTYTATFNINIDGTTLTNNDTFEGGNKEGTTVTYIATKEETIPVIPHKWTVSNVQWSSDNHLAVVTFSCDQNGSSHTETVIVTTTEDKENGYIIEENDATSKGSVCTGEGTVTYTIKVHYPDAKPGDDFVTNEKLTKIIRPEGLGHEWLVDITKDTDDGIKDGFVWVEKEDGTYTVTLNLKCSRCDTTTSLVVENVECTTNEGEEGYNHCVDDLIKTYTATFTPENAKITDKDNIDNIPTTSIKAEVAEDAIGHNWEANSSFGENKDGFEWKKENGSYTVTLHLICNHKCGAIKEVTPVLSVTTEAGNCTTLSKATYTATYTEDGLKLTSTKEDISSETIPGHSWIVDTTHDGSDNGFVWELQDDGSYKVTVYIKCNNIVASKSCTENREIEISNVSVETKPATCTENGQKIYTAKLDLDTITAKIYGTGDAYKGEQDKFAEVTSTLIVEDKDNPATGHEWEVDTTIGNDGWTWTQEGEGYVAYVHLKCKKDGSHTKTVKVESVESAVHSATCEKPGDTRYNASLDKVEDGTIPEGGLKAPELVQDRVPATGHEWVIDPEYADTNGWEWIWDNKTNTYTNAYLHLVCNHADCDDEENKVRTLEAKVSSDVVQELSCTNDELTTYTAVVKLTNLKDGINDTFNGISNTDTKTNVVTAKATGHEWIVNSDSKYENGWEWIWDNKTNTYTNAYLHLICTHADCEYATGHEYVINASLTYVVTQELSCANDELTNYTAEVTLEKLHDNDTFNDISNTDTKTKVVTAKATGHAWNVDTTHEGSENGFVWVEKDGTYTVTVYFVCTNASCTETHSLSHTFKEAENFENGSVTVFETKDATCTTPEQKTYQVTFNLSDENAGKVNEVQNRYVCALTQITSKTYEIGTPSGHLWKINDDIKTANPGGDLISGWTWQSNSDGTYTATLHLICSLCGELHTVTIANIEGSVEDSKCDVSGTTTYTAILDPVKDTWKKTEYDKFVDDVELLTSSYITPIEIKGHEWVISTKNDTDGVKDGWTWAEDYRTATLHLICNREGCTYHETEYTITVSTTNTVVNATCDTPTITTYKAVVDTTLYNKTMKDVFTDVPEDDKSYKAELSIEGEVLGHNWEASYDWTYNKDADKYDVTITLTCTNNNSHTYTYTLKDVIANVKEATCLEEGTKTYTARFNIGANKEINTNDTKDGKEIFTEKDTFVGATEYAENKYYEDVTVTSIDVIPHKWTVSKVEWAADCHSVVVTFLCTENGSSHTESRTITTTNINGNVITETPVEGNTCTGEGTVTYTATVKDPDGNFVTNEAFTTTKAGTALGHIWLVDTAKDTDAIKDGFDWKLQEDGTYKVTLNLKCSRDDCGEKTSLECSKVTSTDNKTDIFNHCVDDLVTVYTTTANPSDAKASKTNNFTGNDNIDNIPTTSSMTKIEKATGHTWNIDVEKDTDESKDGFVWSKVGDSYTATLYLKCTNAGCETHKTVTPVLSATTEAGNCTTASKTTYTATYTIDGSDKVAEGLEKTLTSTFTATGTIPGHSWIIDTTHEGSDNGFVWVKDSDSYNVTVYIKCNNTVASGACGATSSVTIKVTTKKDVPPTCTEDGKTIYSTTITREQVIEGLKVEFYKDSSYQGEWDKFAEVEIEKIDAGAPKKGHAWELDTKSGTNGWTWAREGEKYVAYAHLICKTDEKHIRTVQADINTFTKDPTCETEGYTEYTATLTAEKIEDGTLAEIEKATSTLRTNIVPAKGHTWEIASGYENGWEWIWNKETNTYTAKLHLVCNQEKCEQNKVERVLEAKVTTSNVKAATCNTPETKDFTATVELTNLKEGINDTFNGISNTDTKANVETAALIGHNWIVDTTYGEGSGWTWNDDNSQATLHLICKHEDSACGATYEIVVSSTSDEKQKLLCEQDGIIEYTATINSLPSLAAGDLDSRLTTKDKFNGILDLSTSKEVTTEATGHAWQVDTTKGENGFVWTDTSVTLYFTCAHLGCEATHSLTKILTSDNIIDSVDATCTGSSLITYRVQFDLDVSNANGAKNTYACATPQISTKTLESTVTTAKGHIWKISNAVWTEGAEAGWEWTYNESSKDWTVTLHLECARCGQIHTIQFTDITTDNVVHETCLTEGYEDLYCTFNSNDATVENGQKLTEQDNYQLPRASITTNYHGNVIPATGHTWTVDTSYDEDGFVNGWKWDLDTLIATVRLVCVCNSEHTGCAEWCDCDGITMTATRKTSSVNVPADKCLDDTTTTYTATVLLEDIKKEANTTANDKLIDGVESFTNSITLVTTAALGHQWTIDTDPQYENGWEWSKDYSKAYLHLICSHEGCSEKLTLESNLDVKVVQESSCIQKELTTYTATAIVPDLTAKELASPLTAKDTFIIEGNNVSIKANIETKDALGHQYVLGEWEWYQADLANNESWTARLHFECKVCGDEHVIEADSVSHVTEGSEIKFTATVNKSHFEGKDSYVDGKDVVLTEDQQDTITKDRSSVNHVWIVDESYGDGTGWTWEEVAGKWVATLHFVCQDNDGATHMVVATMSESTIDATCEDCGKIVYNALVDLTPENAYDEAYEGYTNTWGSNIVNTASKEVDDETNKAIGHKWTTDSKWTWSENNTIAALRFVCENDENHVMNVVATTTEVDGNVITIDDHYAPTCTLTGDLIYNAKIIGPDGKTYYSSRVEVVPALGHQYVVDTSKGYNLDGIEWDFVNNTATLVLKCNECGHTIRVATEAIVVDPTDLEAKDATCTDTGLTVYKVEFTNVSSMVGENDKFLGDDTQIGRYEVVVKANGHKWYYEPGEAPTIQEEGPAEWIYQTDERGYVVAVIGVFRCVICGYEERVAGEVDELEIFQEQTCTDDGEYVYYGRVTFEGITYYDGMWFETTIPATGHNYVIDDTLSEDGITWEEVEGKWMATLHLICSNGNCHHTLEIEKEAIANDSLYVASDCEHDERFVYEVTFDLTGEIASPDTFNANNIQKASKEVIGTEATGHSWNLTPKWFFEEDNHSASASFSCDNCGRTFVMDADVVEVYTPATCDSNSSSVFTATVTFFGVEYTSSVTVVYDNTALDHVWSDPIWSWSEDNKQATATFICERDHTHIETVVATNSRDLINYIEVDTSNEATCEKDGTIVYTAIITGPDGKEHRNSVTKTVYAIGHDWIIDSNPEYENGFEWLPSGRYAIMHFVCANDATHTHLVEAVITSEVTQELSCAHDEVTIFTATAHFKEYNNDIKLVSRKTVTTKKALEHTYGTPTWVFEDDNTTARAIFTCSKCGHIMALDATMDFVEVVPTCTEDGYTIVTAKVTYNNITYSETRNVVHEKTALGHSWHLSGWTWSEDYSEAVANFVCDRCNENYAGEASIVISNDDDNNTIYTATVIGPDDITYTDIKIVEEVVDISVDFILLLAEIILLIAGTAILGNMISAAGAMMLLLDNKKRKTKQILVKRAG